MDGLSSLDTYVPLCILPKAASQSLYSLTGLVQSIRKKLKLVFGYCIFLTLAWQLFFHSPLSFVEVQKRFKIFFTLCVDLKLFETLKVFLCHYHSDISHFHSEINAALFETAFSRVVLLNTPQATLVIFLSEKHCDLTTLVYPLRLKVVYSASVWIEW